MKKIKKVFFLLLLVCVACTSCTSVKKQVSAYNTDVKQMKTLYSRTNTLMDASLQAVINFCVYYKVDDVASLENLLSSDCIGINADANCDTADKLASQWGLVDDPYDSYLKTVYSGCERSLLYDEIMTSDVEMPFKNCEMIFNSLYTNYSSEYQTQVCIIRGTSKTLLIKVFWSNNKIIGIERRM